MFFIAGHVLVDAGPGRKIFGITQNKAERTNLLAANHVILFFLTCGVIAGVYAALSAKILILYIQALPALAAIYCFNFITIITVHHK